MTVKQKHWLFILFVILEYNMSYIKIWYDNFGKGYLVMFEMKYYVYDEILIASKI